ncbi:MAG: archease [archaeon]
MKNKNSRQKDVRYKFLEHTADAKFQAFGKTIEEKFSNAALAMFSIMVDTAKVKAKIEKKVSIEGRDEKSLLYNFLEELLFLLDTEHFLLNKVKLIKIFKDKNKNRLDAIFTGDNEIKKYQLLGEVKAVTYNDMDINPEYVQVVVDL